MKGHRAGFFVSAAFAYIVVCLVFFGKVLFFGQFLFGSDFMLYFYPMKAFLREYVLQHGTLPLWNPYTMCGMPFLADIQVSAFYPFGFLFYFLPVEAAYGWTIAVHFFLAAMGMFVFTSRMEFSGVASWIAGIIYAFNGFALRHLFAGHLTFFQTMAWAPWVWCAYLYTISYSQGDSGKTRGWAVVSVCVSFMLLGGFPQVAFYALLFLLALAVIPPVSECALSLPRRFFIFVVTVSTGFALSAVQLLPTLELTSWSTRADGLVYDAAVRDSMRLCDLFNICFPRFFGSPTDGTYWGTPSTSFFWETGAYVGILAVVAMIGFRWISATRFERFCVVLFCLAVFMSLGGNNPLFPMIHKLPVIKNFRVPSQILYLAVTAASISAAALVDRVNLFPIRRIPAFAFALTMCVTIFAVFFVIPERFPDSYRLYARPEIVGALSVFVVKIVILTFMIRMMMVRLEAGKMNMRTAGVLLALFTFVDLYWANHHLIRPAMSYQNIREDTRKIRASVEENPDELYRVSVSGSYVFGNSTLLSGQYGVLGYNPLVLSHYVRFLLAGWGQPMDREDYMTLIPPITRIDPPALRLLGLRYVVDADKSETHILTSTLPRAFWIRNDLFLTEDQALEKIGDTGFEPEKVIIVSGGRDTIPVQSRGREVFFSASCRFLEYEPDRLKIEIAAPDDSGYLFLSDVFYPGWKATVDGLPADILRANFAFRAVRVPSGRHVVEMRYSPASLRIGAWVSGIGICICCFFILRRFH